MVIFNSYVKLPEGKCCQWENIGGSCMAKLDGFMDGFMDVHLAIWAIYSVPSGKHLHNCGKIHHV